MASTQDITAFALVFPEDDGGIQLLVRCWCPEARLWDENNKNRERYRQWKSHGWLRTTEGNAIDYAVIRKAIEEDARKFNLRVLGIDRLFQGYETGMVLESELSGLCEVVLVSQSFMQMAIPTKEFERLYLEGKIRHGGNPILRWMAGNAVVARDSNDNIKVDKKRSVYKIDGIVATIIAIDCWTRKGQGKRCVYENRDIRFLTPFTEEVETTAQ